MPDDLTQALTDRLAGLERELERLTTGIALLGIKPCVWCRKFFRNSDPGILFEAGPTVCYGCIPEWWHHQSDELTTKQRETVEFELKNWLVRAHHAEVVKSPDKLSKDPVPKLQIVVSCYECGASGNLHDERCRFCDGRGTVWVVVH